MPAMLLKACPRCGGDLQWDSEDKEWCCLQAGHRFSREAMERIKWEVQEKTLAISGRYNQ